MTTPRHRYLLSVIAAVAMLAFFACGDGGPKASSDPGVFYKGDAGTVRVFPGSQEASPAKTTGDTLTQTFTVSASPTEVSQFLTNTLPGWAPVQSLGPNVATGSQYKAAWENGGKRLQLTTDSPARDAGEKPPIQYTLMLQD